jgi:hypothetical protein
MRMSFTYIVEQQIINYLLKLEDGITPIEITEFVRTVIKMNSVMKVNEVICLLFSDVAVVEKREKGKAQVFQR